MFASKKVKYLEKQIEEMQQSLRNLDKELIAQIAEKNSFAYARKELEKKVELLEQFLPPKENYLTIGTASGYYHGDCWTSTCKKEDYYLKGFLHKAAQELWIKKQSIASNEDLQEKVEDLEFSMARIMEHLDTITSSLIKVKEGQCKKK